MSKLNIEAAGLLSDLGEIEVVERVFFLAEMVQTVQLGVGVDGINPKALGRRGTLQPLSWEDEREERMEVRISGVGRWREMCSC